MKRLLSQIVSAILGLWLATMFAGAVVRVYPESNFFGFAITAQWQMFLMLGIILGALNYFIKPILKTFNLPFESVAIGFFSFFVTAGFIYILDMIFDELYVPWMYPLLYTTLIIWILNLLLQKFLIREYNY